MPEPNVILKTKLSRSIYSVKIRFFRRSFFERFRRVSENDHFGAKKRPCRQTEFGRVVSISLPSMQKAS
jgi:hypothetical protein